MVHRDLERGQQGTVITEKILTELYGAPQVIGTKALYTTTPTNTEIVPPAEWIDALTNASPSEE